MPRSNAGSIQNSFVQGLITEATGLTFPENACTETENCNFDRTGLVSRRLGFDFEQDFVSNVVDLSGNVVSTFLWTDVAGDGNTSFVVVQNGNTLSFYKASQSGALSNNLLGTTIDLTDFIAPAGSAVNSIECQFTDGTGTLIVTHPQCETFYVTYDPDTDDITATQLNLMIRDDISGDPQDTLGVSERPATNFGGLTVFHHYNLNNQGWTDANLMAWDTARTDMPSNCDVAWYYKAASGAYDFTIVDNYTIGNSPAAKGHNIFSVYNIDRDSIITGATTETINNQRVSTCAFFAGRVFYSGLAVQGKSGYIFFSQIAQTPDQFGKCYQLNDPASEELSTLLSSDGGIVVIPEAGTIVKMIPVLNALVVYATNGIWTISGSSGIGFTATDYAVNKISSIITPSATSFVLVEGVPYWWNLDGIYTLNANPQNVGSNPFIVTPLTDTTIKTYFNDIPPTNKKKARGVYNLKDKVIQWVFKSTDDSKSDYIFDTVLTLNLLTNAFYPWTVNTDLVQINSIVAVIGLGGTVVTEDVVSGADTVMSGGDTVVANVITEQSIGYITKFLVSSTDISGNTNLTFAESNVNNGIVDWLSYNNVGEDYESYFITGFSLKGKAITKFQRNYVYVYSNNITDGSFQFSARWDYANVANSGRWTSNQILTNTGENFQYQVHRVKARGRGLVCQFKVTNNGTDPFNIIGWSAMESINQWV